MGMWLFDLLPTKIVILFIFPTFSCKFNFYESVDLLTLQTGDLLIYRMSLNGEFFKQAFFHSLNLSVHSKYYSVPLLNIFTGKKMKGNVNVFYLFPFPQRNECMILESQLITP